MRYDRGYGQRYDGGYQGGGRAPRGYDFGLRGYEETAPRQLPIRMRTYDRDLRARGGYDEGFDGRPWFSNRVTQSYNREYVHPKPERNETNYVSYGGDVEGRIVDASGYWRPYHTTLGSRTMRGSGMPVGWEREEAMRRYDNEFRRYGRDFRGRGR